MKKFEIWQELSKCKSDQKLLKKNGANRLTLYRVVTNFQTVLKKQYLWK